DLDRGRTSLLLAQHANDLLLREPALLHRPSPDDGLSYQPREPQGSRSWTLIIPIGFLAFSMYAATQLKKKKCPICGLGIEEQR
ncbi:MAG: hypothetical protein RIM84_09350, partial [Alphaproteobacteria bacterium]